MITFPGPLGRLSPPRRRLWLAVLALVGAAVLVPLGVAALDSEPAPVPVAQDRPGPVLLVPGYGGSTDSLEVLASRLRDEGRDVRLVPAPGDGTGDLRAQADNLGRVVDAVLARTGAPSVDLVGYSAGGVVVRWYVAFLGGSDDVRRVVTLASPHHGTDLAALAVGVAGSACPLACQQLAPDSDVIFALNRGDETPDGPPGPRCGPSTTRRWCRPTRAARRRGGLRRAGRLPGAGRQSRRHADARASRGVAVQTMVVAALGAGRTGGPGVPEVPASR